MIYLLTNFANTLRSITETQRPQFEWKTGLITIEFKTGLMTIEWKTGLITIEWKTEWKTVLMTIEWKTGLMTIEWKTGLMTIEWKTGLMKLSGWPLDWWQSSEDWVDDNSSGRLGWSQLSGRLGWWQFIDCTKLLNYEMFPAHPDSCMEWSFIGYVRISTLNGYT